jgi:hypothetical protein
LNGHLRDLEEVGRRHGLVCIGYEMDVTMTTIRDRTSSARPLVKATRNALGEERRIISRYLDSRMKSESDRPPVGHTRDCEDLDCPIHVNSDKVDVYLLLQVSLRKRSEHGVDFSGAAHYAVSTARSNLRMLVKTYRGHVEREEPSAFTMLDFVIVSEDNKVDIASLTRRFVAR